MKFEMFEKTDEKCVIQSELLELGSTSKVKKKKELQIIAVIHFTLTASASNLMRAAVHSFKQSRGSSDARK